MTESIDINADLGEGFPNDAELLTLVTSASISCSVHAGDRDAIRATILAARERGVSIGAHPGYPDREHFGRREQSFSTNAVEGLIVEQVETLALLAAEVDLRLNFVKPHGALYNQAQRDPLIAQGVISACQTLHLPVLGQPGGVLDQLAHEVGLKFVSEGFPDRRYEPDGRLVPRSRPDAVLHDRDEVEAQVVRMVAQKVATLCIHGDDPRAVDNATRVREALASHGIIPRFWS